jgi:hypothetical protein
VLSESSRIQALLCGPSTWTTYDTPKGVPGSRYAVRIEGSNRSEIGILRGTRGSSGSELFTSSSFLYPQGIRGFFRE